jgi:hypothetical protein
MSESRAAALKRHYEEQLAKQLAEREAEAERENAAMRAKWEQAETELFASLAPFIPEGVLVIWKTDQTKPRNWLAGWLAVDGEDMRHLVDFIARQDNGELEMRVKIGDYWREAYPARLAEYIGAEIKWQDEQLEEETRRIADRAARAEAEAAEHAKWQAESDKNRAEAVARDEAARAQAAAEKAARRAEKLARRVAEAEAIAAAQAKHLVNPSGMTYDEISHMATQALDTAQDAGDRLPAVEQLRAEIAIYERQLKEAQAAATWGVNGANETERKNNAARALAADPQVKQIQTALDEMNRRLAVIEPEYKAVAMKSGAWRAVCELYAGWLQSLR